ncbi:hypothetical protein SynM161_01518 [Synechococcus sp. M16.1]|nr:hypothetical protein SynM161_01518 [Synechococcus sp. M16.1]
MIVGYSSIQLFFNSSKTTSTGRLPLMEDGLFIVACCLTATYLG